MNNVLKVLLVMTSHRVNVRKMSPKERRCEFECKADIVSPSLIIQRRYVSNETWEIESLFTTEMPRGNAGTDFF